MSRSHSDEQVDRTQAQAEPPTHRTGELSGDSTNPTFGSLSADAASGFPFLSPPQAPDEIGRLGEYRVLQLLGEGGMGFVFRGEDTALRRPVALKVMRPEVATKPNATDRFLREGRAAAGLKSDHVITIYQVGQANGVPFLAMEFLEGLPVDAWLRKQTKPVTLSLAVRVARDCLRGLAAAHEKGLIHRDIKPANLWIEKGTGRVKVLDFGLTRGADGSDQMTVEGAVVGTPAFMAPEQAHGKPVDPRADLFSVGTVLHTLLTGKNPFQRDSLMGTLGAVGFEEVPAVTEVRPDVPAAHAAFVAKLLSKNPADRPADAKAALKELAAIEKQVEELPATVPPDPATGAQTRWAVPATDGPRKPTANRWRIAGGLFGFLALAVGGIVVVITNKDGTKTTIVVPDGATVEVRADGAAAPAVGPPPAPTVEPIRRLAARVLAKGGTVTADDNEVRDPQTLTARPAKLKLEHRLQTTQPLSDDDLVLLKEVGGVDELQVYGAFTDRGVEGLLGSASAARLRSLSIASARLTDSTLLAAARFPALTEVYIDNKATIESPGGVVTGSGLAAFAGRPLTYVGFARCPRLRNEHLAVLATMPALKTVLLHEVPLDDVGLGHIARVRTLETIDLRDLPAVTDAGLRLFEDHPTLWCLQYGQLAGPGLTTRSLASVGRIPRLIWLDVGLPVSDADLAPIVGHQSLSTVRLTAGEGVTDAGLTALAGLKPLQHLTVTGSRVTTAGAAKFRAARPDVTLVWVGDKK